MVPCFIQSSMGLLRHCSCFGFHRFPHRSHVCLLCIISGYMCCAQAAAYIHFTFHYQVYRRSSFSGITEEGENSLKPDWRVFYLVLKLTFSDRVCRPDALAEDAQLVLFCHVQVFFRVSEEHRCHSHTHCPLCAPICAAMSVLVFKEGAV